MPKFFVNKSQISGNIVTIAGGDVLHISKVLRMNEGDSLTVCDGCGNDYDTRICGMSKSDITAEIIDSYRCEAEPNIEVILFQCLPKQGKMEYIIQKNTELGVSKIIPVYSKRCVAKPSGKHERWQKVAAEAAKQCGRGIIPEICETISFDEAIKRLIMLNCCFMLYENEKHFKLRQILEEGKATQIGVLIGPEGGFDESEAELAKINQIPTVTLGKRILRTETAGAAVLPIIMYTHNDI